MFYAPMFSCFDYTDSPLQHSGWSQLIIYKKLCGSPAAIRNQPTLIIKNQRRACPPVFAQKVCQKLFPDCYWFKVAGLRIPYLLFGKFSGNLGFRFRLKVCFGIHLQLLV